MRVRTRLTLQDSLVALMHREKEEKQWKKKKEKGKKEEREEEERGKPDSGIIVIL